MDAHPLADDGVIARVDRARQLLAEARDAGQAKQIADLARAAEIFARRQRLSEEAIEYATAVKIDAMTMMGEFLKEAPKNEGAKGSGSNQYKQVVRSQNETAPPTLSDAGISKRESSDAQLLATVKDQSPELYAEVRSGQKKVSHLRAEMKRAGPTAKPPQRKPDPINPDVTALIGQLSSLAESLTEGRSFWATARTYPEQSRWALADQLESLSKIMFRRATELRNRP